ncbi:DUF2079 domain-containing protein [Spirillospora sp. CA-294931]|uniref:DUF2079 domain-containing protein n=1 Tax=Spirillospora sp. CA-294931 TaxID=3240042 RepID=UPI003D9216CC
MAQTATVGRVTETTGSRTARWRPPMPLVGMVAVMAVVYAAYTLLRLRAFRATTYDLVIFDQAVRSYSRFDLPVAMVKGVHNGFGPDFNVLGDHFSPILVLLAPLYWIHDGPGTLLVAQAVLLALASLLIWRYTERRLGAQAAYCAVGAYAVSWPIAEALNFDFHEVAFIPLLTALIVERYDAGRRGHAVLAACVLLLVKEDMGLFLVGFGVYLLTLRGQRRVGAAFIGGGLAAAWISSRVLIAAFGGDNDYYWAYGSLGDDLPDAAVYCLTHPWAVLEAFASPATKLDTLVLLVLPLMVLPLMSPLTLAVLPLLAERMMADRFGNWWEPRYHYNAFIIAVLVMAAVDGAVRLRRFEPARRLARARWGRLRGRTLPALAIMLGMLATVPFFSFGELAEPGLYREGERDRAAARAVAAIPDGALVESVNQIGPALSPRARVLLWDRRAREAPWVVADVRKHAFPFTTVDEQRQRVTWLLGRGYRAVFQAAGYVVLHRPGPDPW